MSDVLLSSYETIIDVSLGPQSANAIAAALSARRAEDAAAAAEAVAVDVQGHVDDTNNPHQVTAAQTPYAPAIIFATPTPPASTVEGALRARPRSVYDYGARPGIGVDMTPWLLACIEAGGDWEIPDGEYLIRGYGQGTDTGGVYATLVRSLHVRCGPRVRFYSDSGSPLDNDMFCFQAPANGTGLPPELITVTWENGYFDQRAQCVSNSVPFAVEYPPPPGLDGASNTAEALSFRLSYNIAGTDYAAARLTRVSGATFFAGAHWQTAGGDAGIFIGAGSGQGRVSDCRFIGSRDLGVYSSGIASGDQDIVVERSQFDACFGGISSKRGMRHFKYLYNTFRNNVVAMAASPLVADSEKGVMLGNVSHGCSITFRASRSDQNYMAGTQVGSIGAFLANGTTPVAPYGFNAVVWLDGAKGNIIEGFDVPAPLLGQVAATYGVILQDASGVTASGNTIRDVLTTDHSRCVVNGGTGTGNRVEGSYNFGSAGVRDPLMITGDSVIRRDPTTGAPGFHTGLMIGNGSAAEPIIRRATQTNTGLFAAANKIGVSIAGTERWAVTDTAMSLAVALGLPPMTTAQRNALVPSPGLTIFNTTTGAMEVYGGLSWVSGLVQPQQPTPQRPGLVSGESYALVRAVSASATAAHGPDKLVLYPFIVDRPFTATTLNSRVVTGGAGASMKAAIWASDANGRPTGTPIAADNTGVACSTSGQTRNQNMPAVFPAAGWYWVGHLLTGTMPVFSHISTSSMEMAYLLGSIATVNSVSSPVLALTMDVAFATDISALSLTGASFGRITNVGVPVFSLSVA